VSDSLLAGFPVMIEVPVWWGEMDSFRHVNNIVYFRYFENARIEYCRRLEWPDFQIGTGVGPILASAEARFRKALTFPDTVAVGARVIALDVDRFTLEHWVVSRKMGVVAAEGKGVVVAFDYAQGKKVPIPDDLRRRITELEASVGEKRSSAG